jgi:endonuclease-8
MPEGPEIRLAAERVARVLVDRPIVEATFGLSRLRRFGKQLTGASARAIDTRGKAMLTRFDNGLTLYSHNQLYGRWYTVRKRRMPQTSRQLRVALYTPTHSALLYSASDIEVLTDKQLARHPFLLRLGPDILDPMLTVEEIVDRLEAASFRNRALGSLYLDQGYLAGVGNYLRSEILWAAAIDPAQKPRWLESVELRRLAQETLRISKRSYRTRGVTVPPGLARELRAAGKSYEEFRFHVYGRDGRRCYRCDNVIERRTMGSRSLFVCPACQLR